MPFEAMTPGAKSFFQRQEDIRRASQNRNAPEPTPEQIRAYLEQESRTVEQQATDERNEITASEWVNTRPDYKRTAHSGAQMEEYLRARNLPYTHENLNQAFDYLAQRGLIQVNDLSAEVRRKMQDAEVQRQAGLKLPQPAKPDPGRNRPDEPGRTPLPRHRRSIQPRRPLALNPVGLGRRPTVSNPFTKAKSCLSMLSPVLKINPQTPLLTSLFPPTLKTPPLVAPRLAWLPRPTPLRAFGLLDSGTAS